MAGVIRKAGKQPIVKTGPVSVPTGPRNPVSTGPISGPVPVAANPPEAGRNDNNFDIIRAGGGFHIPFNAKAYADHQAGTLVEPSHQSIGPVGVIK